MLTLTVLAVIAYLVVFPLVFRAASRPSSTVPAHVALAATFAAIDEREAGQREVARVLASVDCREAAATWTEAGHDWTYGPGWSA